MYNAQPVVLNRDISVFDGHWTCGGSTIIIGPVEFGAGVSIGWDCVICSRVKIAPNVKIGSKCVIRSGSVITEDLPDGTVV